MSTCSEYVTSNCGSDSLRIPPTFGIMPRMRRLTTAQQLIGSVGIVIGAYLLIASTGSKARQQIDRDDIENAVNAPETIDGIHLTDVEFGKQISRYLPFDADMSPAVKYEVCLSFAEKKFTDVTTAKQRKDACTEYAKVTTEVMQAMRSELIEYLTDLTPSERTAFCKKEMQSMVGQGATQEELDETCEWIAHSWDEAKQELLK